MTHDTTPDGIPGDAEGSVPLLRWTSHPLRQERPAKSAVLIGFIAALSVGVDVSFQGHVYGVLTFGLLTGFLSRYFAPTRYECTFDALVVSHLGTCRQFPWNRFRRVVAFPEGLFLSPFARPSRLDRFQGCFVRYGESGEEVRAFVEERMAEKRLKCED